MVVVCVLVIVVVVVVSVVVEMLVMVVVVVVVTGFPFSSHSTIFASSNRKNDLILDSTRFCCCYKGP